MVLNIWKEMNSLIYSRILDHRHTVLIDDDDGIGIEYKDEMVRIHFKENTNKWEIYDCEEECVIESGEVTLVRGTLEGQVWEKLDIDNATEEIQGFFYDLFHFGYDITIENEMVIVADKNGDTLIEFDLYNMQMTDYREESLYDGPVYFNLNV